ncbi:hypothetical protein FRC16_001225 [Serendipita sp. 398]|nr:hypothetical protein FRC16_001225 [Serendipita sp. 398]
MAGSAMTSLQRTTTIFLGHNHMLRGLFISLFGLQPGRPTSAMEFLWVLIFMSLPSSRSPSSPLPSSGTTPAPIPSLLVVSSPIITRLLALLPCPSCVCNPELDPSRLFNTQSWHTPRTHITVLSDHMNYGWVQCTSRTIAMFLSQTSLRFLSSLANGWLGSAHGICRELQFFWPLGCSRYAKDWRSRSGMVGVPVMKLDFRS